MELTLRITDPQDLSRFAEALTSMFPVEVRSFSETPLKTEKRKNNPASAPKTIDDAGVVNASEVIEATEEASAPAESTLTAETFAVDITPGQMRAAAHDKIQEDASNKLKIKELLNSIGAVAISAIPEESREAFMDGLKSL